MKKEIDVYESIKKQKRKSICFAVGIVLMLVVMAIISVYFIVLDNIDSFMENFKPTNTIVESVTDDNGFVFEIKNKDAHLIEYKGNKKVVTIPEKVNDTLVTYIDSFKNENVEEITLPSSLLYIENKAFYHLDKLKVVKGGDLLCSIGEGAFKGCTALESFDFTNKLITIEDEAFCNTNFKKVVIPYSVNSLNKRVFNSCRNLEEIEIGHGVYVIQDQCFKNCKKLKKVVCYGGTISFEDEVFTNCSKDLTVYAKDDSDMTLYCDREGIKRLPLTNK